jgi:hypothetical protein
LGTAPDTLEREKGVFYLILIRIRSHINNPLPIAN